jgi:TRAP-type C4-dicarboxylate transport system permease small subunit
MVIYQKFLDVLTVITKYALIIIVSLMSLLVFLQVPCRYLISSTPPFMTELSTYCLIWTAFIGSSLAFRWDKHVALTFLIERLSSAKAEFVSKITYALVLLFLVVFLAGSLEYASTMWQTKSPTMGFSITWAALGAPIGTVLMILQLVGKFMEKREE